ncbi:MAG: hypothetical protein ACFCD0_23260 [Gemmataceae bacterium]
MTTQNAFPTLATQLEKSSCGLVSSFLALGTQLEESSCGLVLDQRCRMNNQRLAVCILCLQLCLIPTNQLKAGPFSRFFGDRKTDVHDQLQAATLVPIDQLPRTTRPKVKKVLESPTLYTHGPLEKFVASPVMYRWLLDHPNRAVGAWRKLGAKCIEIQDRGNGYFGFQDDLGSDVAWTAIHATKDLRVWYAEGNVKMSRFLPTIPVQCVVIMRHPVVGREREGALMQQRADIFIRTSSRATAVLARLLGPSVPRLARQGAKQLQMFFGAMAWYCNQNPEKVPNLLREVPKAEQRPQTSEGDQGLLNSISTFPTTMSGMK